MASKTCFKCGIEKPLGEFYRHPQMLDGHLNKCKECAKRDTREGRSLRREQYSEYERRRFQQPKRRADQLQAQRRHRQNNPIKAAARTAVHRAIRSGVLIRKPCKFCGSTAGVQAHHTDYSRPLDVEWVCFTCHRQEFHGQVVVTDNRVPVGQYPF